MQTIIIYTLLLSWNSSEEERFKNTTLIFSSTMLKMTLKQVWTLWVYIIEKIIPNHNSGIKFQVVYFVVKAYIVLKLQTHVTSVPTEEKISKFQLQFIFVAECPKWCQLHWTK